MIDSFNYTHQDQEKKGPSPFENSRNLKSIAYPKSVILAWYEPHMAQGGQPAIGTRPNATGALEDIYDRILHVLIKFMSESSAQAALARAERLSGADLRSLRPADTPALFSAIEQAAGVVLDRTGRARLHGELEFELSISIGKQSAAAPALKQSIDVRGEWDVSAARNRARELVTALGGKSYDAVRAMTLVSELARNIVLYTTGGRVDFTSRDSPRSLVVCAADSGPGIPNLADVLSGRHRSKTGLGKGLIGVKRLADRFEIQTGASGTSVMAEVRL